MQWNCGLLISINHFWRQFLGMLLSSSILIKQNCISWSLGFLVCKCTQLKFVNEWQTLHSPLKQSLSISQNHTFSMGCSTTARETPASGDSDWSFSCYIVLASMILLNVMEWLFKVSPICPGQVSKIHCDLHCVVYPFQQYDDYILLSWVSLIYPKSCEASFVMKIVSRAQPRRWSNLATINIIPMHSCTRS